MDEEEDTVLGAVDRAGYHILGCDCENRHWLAIIKKGTDAASLYLFCPLCNSQSSALIPKGEEDRKALKKAAMDMNEKDKDAKRLERDWGEMVNSSPGKKGNGNGYSN